MKEEMAALQQAISQDGPGAHSPEDAQPKLLCYLHVLFNVTLVLTADRQPCFHYSPAGRTEVKAFRWQLGINSIIIA
jgi:hypothetical protein